MKKCLSIIHGANRIGKSEKECSAWQRRFAKKIKATNDCDVQCFYWSGKISDVFSDSLAERYYHHLLDFYHVYDGKCNIYIYGKSIGAIVAERALKRLYMRHPQIKIEMLLRVATPDMRTCLPIPNVKQVRGIYSTTDKLFLISIIPLSLVCMLLLRRTSPVIRIHNDKITGVSHADFNRLDCFFIDAANKRQRLFEQYLHLLSLKSSN